MSIGLADNRSQNPGISQGAAAGTNLKELDNRSIGQNLCQVI